MDYLGAMSLPALTAPYRYAEDEREAIIKHVIERLAEGVAIKQTLENTSEIHWIDATGATRRVKAPGYWTWAKWQSSNDELRQVVAQARLIAADTYVDEAIEIADNDNMDATAVWSKKEKRWVARVNGEAIARSRLRAEMRLKVAAMIAPQTYGDKLDITSGGKALEAPPAVVIDQRIQSIMLKAAERKAIGKSSLLDD